MEVSNTYVQHWGILWPVQEGVILSH